MSEEIKFNFVTNTNDLVKAFKSLETQSKASYAKMTNDAKDYKGSTKKYFSDIEQESKKTLQSIKDKTAMAQKAVHADFNKRVTELKENRNITPQNLNRSITNLKTQRNKELSNIATQSNLARKDAQMEKDSAKNLKEASELLLRYAKEEAKNKGSKQPFRDLQYGSRSPSRNLAFKMAQEEGLTGGMNVAGLGVNDSYGGSGSGGGGGSANRGRYMSLKDRAKARMGRSKGGRFLMRSMAGVAIIGGIAGASLKAGQDREESALRLKAVTGMDTSQEFGVGGVANDMIGAGFTTAEFDRYQTDLAKTRGYARNGFFSRGNKQGGTKRFNSKVTEEAQRLASVELLSGVDRGTFLGISSYQQFDYNKSRQGRAETSFDIDQLYKTMRLTGAIAKGDKSRMGEFAETMSKRAFSASNLSETIDTDQIISNMGKMYLTGGSFSDSRMGDRMQTMNNALINPNNDFKQAFNFSILRKLNPNASFVELQKMREKGMGQEGFLETSLKSMRNMSGSNNDLFEQLISSRLGVGYQQAETLRKGFDSGSWENLTEEERKKMETLGFGLNNKDKLIEKASKSVGTATTISKEAEEIASGVGVKVAEALKPFVDTLTDILTDERGVSVSVSEQSKNWLKEVLGL